MQSDATTRDPAISEAMLPKIDAFMMTLESYCHPSRADWELWNHYVRMFLSNCLAIAERERAERELIEALDASLTEAEIDLIHETCEEADREARERAERTEARAE